MTGPRPAYCGKCDEILARYNAAATAGSRKHMAALLDEYDRHRGFYHHGGEA